MVSRPAQASSSTAKARKPSKPWNTGAMRRARDGWWNTADMGADYPLAAGLRLLHGQSLKHSPPSSRTKAMNSAPTTHLLYLHGFRSSPQSTKARQVAQRVRERHPQLHWWCPQLPPSPHEAIELVMRGIAHWPRDSMAVVGSSL